MKLTAPKIPHKNLLGQGDVSLFVTEATLEDLLFLGGDFTSQRATNVSLDEVWLEKAIFTQANMEQLMVRDGIFHGCDFSAANCSSGSCIRVKFSGGRMAGIDVSGSTLQDVTFADCKLDMANFRACKLTRVKFSNCALVETDFQGATFTDVAFENCTLEKTVFNYCEVKNLDLRSSQLFDLRGWQSLRGAQIDTAQLTAVAPELAMEIGLRVED